MFIAGALSSLSSTESKVSSTRRNIPRTYSSRTVAQILARFRACPDCKFRSLHTLAKAPPKSRSFAQKPLPGPTASVHVFRLSSFLLY